jgi:hypothetical protein
MIHERSRAINDAMTAVISATLIEKGRMLVGLAYFSLSTSPKIYRPSTGRMENKSGFPVAFSIFKESA